MERAPCWICSNPSFRSVCPAHDGSPRLVASAAIEERRGEPLLGP